MRHPLAPPAVYVNTHFNHPWRLPRRRVTPASKLARAGVALETRLFSEGINNDPFVMRKLNHELLRIMVRPYYIFHAKRVKGTSHFWTKVGGSKSWNTCAVIPGLAVPTFIINAPHGYGRSHRSQLPDRHGQRLPDDPHRKTASCVTIIANLRRKQPRIRSRTQTDFCVKPYQDRFKWVPWKMNCFI